MERPPLAAFATLAVKPVRDLLPVGVYLDDRAQAWADPVHSFNPFEMHLGEPPHTELAGVKAPAEVGYRSVGQLRMR